MSEYYGVQRVGDDHLQHYGVLGMRWGVRRAVKTGNERKLSRKYLKAAKKLNKYENIADHSTRYGLKAAKYGAAAAGVGALAISGRKGAGAVIRGSGKVLNSAGKLTDLGGKALQKTNSKFLKGTGSVISKLSDSAQKSGAALKTTGDTVEASKKWDATHNLGNAVNRNLSSLGYAGKGKQAQELINKVGLGGNITNEGLYRLGTGAVALGLAAKAGQNAYRAGHAEKYAKKAEKQREKMDKIFKDTIYEGHYDYKKKNKNRETDDRSALIRYPYEDMIRYPYMYDKKRRR